MPSCFAINCGMRQDNLPQGVSFHRFPRDINLCRQWVINCGRDIGSVPEFVKEVLSSAKPRHFLCSKHFEESQFHLDYQHQLLPDEMKPKRLIRKLIKGAVPSIFALSTSKTQTSSVHRLQQKQQQQQTHACGSHQGVCSPIPSTISGTQRTEQLLTEIQTPIMAGSESGTTSPRMIRPEEGSTPLNQHKLRRSSRVSRQTSSCPVVTQEGSTKRKKQNRQSTDKQQDISEVHVDPSGFKTATTNEVSIQEESVNESVILISDCDDDVCYEADDVNTTLEPSVLVIDPVDGESSRKESSEEIIDEECGLAITFSKKGNVMPHARYDCPENPFVKTEYDTSAPLEKNSSYCDQCFCYICDKQANKCEFWTVVSLCHCNAHNKSKYWKAQRDTALAGVLTIFNFDLTEIDTDLRRGGALLLKFIQDLSVEYSQFLKGVIVNYDDLCPCFCVCHTNFRKGQFCNRCRHQHVNIVVFRYAHVFNLVTQFLNQAEEENPKTASIMLLGAAKEVLLHKEPTYSFVSEQNKSESLKFLIQLLMQRITESLQKKLVLCDFPEYLFKKIILFFQSLPLPPFCFQFSNCLNVLPWNDLLLTSVLKGQNITGEQKNKGKKKLLWESITVVEARVERMEARNEYRELVRYLKVVKATDTLKLRNFRDRIPFYLCALGDLRGGTEAMTAFNNIACCTACRLTAEEFCDFLKMARTGASFTKTGEWTVVGDAEQLKKSVLLKCAVRILNCNKICYKSSSCWACLILSVCSMSVLGAEGQLVSKMLQEPPAEFQDSVMASTVLILNDLKTKANVCFPQPFTSKLYNEAELILATQAVVAMLLQDIQHLTSILPVLLAYGRNMWALKILVNGITWKRDVLCHFSSLVKRDLLEQENKKFELLLTVDSNQICDLILVFLSHCNSTVHSVGMVFLNVIVKNWKSFSESYSWSKSLGMLLHREVFTAVPNIATPQFIELKKQIQETLAEYIPSTA
ncbi:uncharacterized protein LOC122816730 [Protopterus annectens]|uniref:uncharacterized protein LOC122816730 n=1 Tax=Protopterus annectens TaxID=7888 RepID=UPI001CFA86C8|nr:uncharacterized protein LOC122816730 [Protopterus annectens]